MNNCSPIIKSFLLVLSFVFMVSCDTDFNQLGSDVVDGDIHNNIIQYTAGISAYDMPTGGVQSNNLDLNSLGVLKNAVFGKTVASFVTQVQLNTTAPSFDQPLLDSVYLYVPYYSTIVATATDGSSTYTTDSIYGDTTNVIRLKVRRNGYYLRDADATSPTSISEKYYTSDKPLIDNQAGVSLLPNSQQDTLFRFSSAEIHRKAVASPNTAAKTVENLTPGMYLPLDVNYFKSIIIDAEDSGNLANNNVFANYFRGLYFEAEQVGDQAVMAMPRFKEGKITLRYRDVQRKSNGNIVYVDSTVVDPVPAYVSKTLVLNLTGNTVNLFENTYEPAFTSAIASSFPVTGDSKLYLKGGEGSVAFIDINPNDINALKQINTGQKLLINEANLVFYVDQATMANAPVEPMRIFLFDANNKRAIYDFYTDITTLAGYPKYNKYIHGGLLEYDANKKGVRYKIRITDHINNLVNKDSTNVKLGLVVTESIGLTANSYFKNPENAGGQQVLAFPSTSVMHPFGTVLYGSNIPEGDPDYDKRVRLEIFYTKPE